MARNQIIYNQVGVYVGPAPSSGYHFINQDSALNNNWDQSLNNYNLVFPLNRVTSLSYSIEPKRTNVSHLGNLGTIKNPILEYTDVNLNLNYLMMGLINDARIGLFMNIPSGDPLYGQPIYGTGRICPILGFYSRNFSQPAISTGFSGFNWPLEYRDSRNIFAAVGREGVDFNIQTGNIETGTNYQGNIYVYGFGDCYLNSYSCSMGVKQLPNVSLNYTCNNLEVYDSGIGQDIPSLNKKDYNIYSGIKFNIPSNFQGTGQPTVLIPSDISLSIKQRSTNSENLDDNFIDFTDIKIQDLTFDFSLNRKPLYSLGYKYPVDRIPTFPVFCNLNFNCVVGDPKAGSMASLLKRDEEYDIQIKLDYQQGNGLFQGTAIQYDFIGAKIKNFDAGLAIGQRKAASFGFTTEMDPTDTTKGLFISGYLSILSVNLNALYLSDYFLGESEISKLLYEDLNQFLIAERKYKLVF